MKLALILLLLAPLLSAQIFYPPGSVRRYAGTPTAGDCTASAGGRKAADISAIPTQPYTCIQTSSGVWEWQAEGSGGGGSGDVGGGPSLTTAGACVYVASNGTLAQATSPGCRWDAVNARLGLGTASPGATIDVTQVGSTPGARVSGGTNPVFQVATDTSGTGVTAKLQVVGSSYALFGTQTNHPLQVLTNNTARVTVTETGSVGIGPSNTSPSGTLHVYDATASTGVTTLTVRAGAGQSTTNIFRVLASDGTTSYLSVRGDGQAFAGSISTTSEGLAIADSGLSLRAASTVLWSSTSQYYGTKDLGLARSSANNLGVTNGSSTTYWTLGLGGIQSGVTTWNDPSSSGTVASKSILGIAAPTLTASSSTTFTTASTLRIGGAPTASTNVTIGTPYALEVAAGASYFGGSVSVIGAVAASVGLSLGPSNNYIQSTKTGGDLQLLNAAGNGFGLLQFGGTTSSFPALKRSTTGLAVRLADDSADAPITASNVTASSDFIGSSTSCLYLGATGTDGTWRICRSSTSIVFERRESGSYVSKGNFTP